MLADTAIGESTGDIRMINSTYIKAHSGRAAAVRISAAQKEVNGKLHLIVDEYGLPVSGTIADCSQAPFLDGLEEKTFLADKAYDTNELFDTLKEAHISAIIPPVKSRKEQ